MRWLTSGLILLLLLVQYRLWVAEGALTQLRRLEARVESQREENEALRQRNARLEAEVLDLKQGLDAVEARARSELDMIREGETFYLIVD